MPNEIEPYVKVYVWLLKQPDLTTLDAALISLLTLFPAGCYISSNKLRKRLGCNIRTIQKKIYALQKKGWTAILPDECSNRRFVWATLKDPPIGPLFDYNEKAEKQMQKQRAKNARVLIQRTAKQLSFW